MLKFWGFISKILIISSLLFFSFSVCENTVITREQYNHFMFVFFSDDISSDIVFSKYSLHIMAFNCCKDRFDKYAVLLQFVNVTTGGRFTLET